MSIPTTLSVKWPCPSCDETGERIVSLRVDAGPSSQVHRAGGPTDLPDGVHLGTAASYTNCWQRRALALDSARATLQEADQEPPSAGDGVVDGDTDSDDYSRAVSAELQALGIPSEDSFDSVVLVSIENGVLSVQAVHAAPAPRALATV